MSELQGVFLTSALTILGGVIVLVMGQFLLRFFIKPIHEQAKAIGEVVYVLLFYADLYANPGAVPVFELQRPAADALRRSASQLMATSHPVRAYGLWAWLGLAPPLRGVLQATHDLIFLSNSVFRGDPAENEAAVMNIVKSLRLRRLEMLFTRSEPKVVVRN